MANNFTFGGEQNILVRRVLAADDRWIPSASASVAGMDGTAIAFATTEMAGVGSTNGFFQMEAVPVSIWFVGLSAATVEMQVYNPISTAWETFIASDKWLDEPGKVLIAPCLPWRVGCVTLAGDTLAVNACFLRGH